MQETLINLRNEISLLSSIKMIFNLFDERFGRTNSLNIVQSKIIIN